MENTLAVMDEYNIFKGFFSGVDISTVKEWKKVAPKRFIAAPYFLNPGVLDPKKLRQECTPSRIGSMGEIGTQLIGISP
jgi:uncharacterized protein